MRSRLAGYAGQGDGQLHARLPAKRALECSSCGYGIACSGTAGALPDVSSRTPWTQTRRRPLRGEIEQVI